MTTFQPKKDRGKLIKLCCDDCLLDFYEPIGQKTTIGSNSIFHGSWVEIHISRYGTKQGCGDLMKIWGRAPRRRAAPLFYIVRRGIVTSISDGVHEGSRPTAHGRNFFASPHEVWEGSGEAGLRHCGRHLCVSGRGAGRLGGKPTYGTAIGIFTFPDAVWEGSGEASLRHCGRNLYVSGWGAGRLGGKPTHGTAIGIFTFPDGVWEGSGEASLRHCRRNLYVSGWGAGRLGGKPTHGTAIGIFTFPDGVREGSGEAGLRHCRRNLYVSGWGAGRLGGKPAYGTGVGIFTFPDWVGEG